ncbi:MAG TPA: hypothetical protein DCP69_01980 [Candidatus Omnitrophica bacterium]|nr:hypothetical protein [Candidatus Omnitrophota bacterium]
MHHRTHGIARVPCAVAGLQPGLANILHQGLNLRLAGLQGNEGVRIQAGPDDAMKRRGERADDRVGNLARVQHGDRIQQQQRGLARTGGSHHSPVRFLFLRDGDTPER